jgi:nicotinamide-nucleotide amidase
VQLAAELTQALAERGETVCTAESLTGGQLCVILTAAPGASQSVRGGVVAYQTSVKHDVVGVDAALLHTYGAVSAQTAQALAAGARRLFDATWAISTTGVAGPATQEGKPVGTVFVAVNGPTSAVVPLQLNGDRDRIREQTCAAAISLLHKAAGIEA